MLSQGEITKLQAAAVATGNGTTLGVAGRRQAVVQVHGTFVGTITWEARYSGQATWQGIAPADLGSTTRARALTATAPGLFLFDDLAGLEELRARISAYTSGDVSAWGRGSD